MLKELVKRYLIKLGIVVIRPSRNIIHGHPLYIGSILFSRKLFILYYFYDKIKDVEGDIIESGIWWGYGILAHLHFAMRDKIKRKIYGFDSFSGHPMPTLEDLKDGNFKDPKKQFIIREDEVWKTLLMGTGYEIQEIKQYVEIIPGWIEQTMPEFSQRDVKIALVHCDPDLYQPVLSTLTNTWPILKKNGIIILGQLNNPEYMGKTKAVMDFLKKLTPNDYVLESIFIHELETFQKKQLYYLVKINNYI